MPFTSTEDYKLRLLEKIYEKNISKLSYWNTEGNCVYANTAYLQWLCKSQMELGMGPVLVVPGQQLSSDYLFEALQSGKETLTLTIEHHGEYHRVTYVPDVEDSITIGCVVQIDEITEFKQKELELVAAEQKFRTIVESAPDALVIVDGDGKVVMLNSRAEIVFGYTPDEVVGKPVEILMAERFRQNHPSKRQGFTQNPHSRQMGNLILSGLRKDGHEFPTDVSLSPMHTSEGILIAAAFRDITAQVEKEQEIKKYHEVLQAQTSQIENILGSISESFCLIDGSWIIRYWNNAAEKMTGKSRSEVLGKVMWDVFPQGPESKLYNECISVMETRVPSYFEHLSTEGNWFYNSAHPNNDGGITVYFKDINARKNSENEIIAIKNNQHALINATKDMMWSVDEAYRLISANIAFVEYVQNLYGYRLETGDSIILNRLTGECNNEWKLLLDCGLRGESFFIELDSMPEQLTQFNPIIDTQSGEIMGVACHSTNTSERNRLKKEKSDSAERFRAVVQNGSDLIFIFDTNFNLNYISPSAVSLLGYERGLLGASILELVHKDSVETVLLNVRKTASQKTVKLEGIKIKDANGKWLWLEATIDNLLDNNAVGGLVLNARDITEQKKREAERELLIKELTRSNSDLMQFSFITSHNLRAPLSNIMGLLAFLDRSKLNEDVALVLGLIDGATQQLTATISDLSQILVIRNKTEIPTAQLDIEEIFHRVNRNFIEAENDVEGQIAIHLAVPCVNFNEHYLESIFINLISNAIKYRSPDRALQIVLESKQEDRGVLISFSDNGKGIDTGRHKSRLFGMYQRFHPNTEGQGLGLFIIKAQINALGGTVTIESTVDEGTTFHIFLPF